jgi:hypothetical protein
MAIIKVHLAKFLNNKWVKTDEVNLINTDKIIVAKPISIDVKNGTSYTKIDLTHAMVTSVMCIETVDEIYEMSNPKTN